MDFASSKRKERDGWTAMRFGCCASREDVDDGREALKANGASHMQVVYDQPQVVPQPRAVPFHHARPSTSQSISRHVSQWVDNSRDLATRASSRASFSTLTRPRRSHSVYRVRPTISGPTNFQHFDNGLGFNGIQSMVDDAPMPVRRNRSFRRLELSIYLPNGCGRLSPLPDFEDEEVWTADQVGLEKPAQALIRPQDSRTNSMCSNPSTSDYLIQRKPVTSSSNSIMHSRHSSVQSQNSTRTERRLSGTTMATMQTPTLSAWVEEPTSSSASPIEKPTIRRSNTSGTLSPARVLSRLPSPSRNRANTAPSPRPGSLRRAKTDVDDAIRELNTIVEERRASAYRTQALSPEIPPSPSHHVPYVAPSMRMHVRSETLSDIGSVFSAPVKCNKALPDAPLKRRTTGLTLEPPSRNSTMALCSNPITPPAPLTPTKSMSRLTTWIRRSMSTSTMTTPTSPRPSTSSSTTYHMRQDSQESSTSTATLISSPAPRKKRVPEPLVLAKEINVEAAVRSARIKPPVSPAAHLLRGMEMAARDVGFNGRASMAMTMHSPGAVGVAF
ncbi:hypothetical protein HBI64_149460 [Parastagonospora nodorum]|nr:hypothetical protein HBI45_175870 [Parastagonospora nodorum]KAH6123954.1 hypothetical protein HBI64_149460 [Parastagonospora nodorum]